MAHARWLFLAGLVLLSCSTPTEPDLEGAWGGSEVSMVLGRTGGTVSYACGEGTIDSGWTLDSSGAFLAKGVHYFGGGPIPIAGRPPHQATYRGTLSGDHLTLSVTISDPDMTFGPFQLYRGGPPVFEICD